MLSNFFFDVLNKRKGFYISSSKLLKIWELLRDKGVRSFPYIEVTHYRQRRKGLLKYK